MRNPPLTCLGNCWNKKIQEAYAPHAPALEPAVKIIISSSNDNDDLRQILSRISKFFLLCSSPNQKLSSQFGASSPPEQTTESWEDRNHHDDDSPPNRVHVIHLCWRNILDMPALFSTPYWYWSAPPKMPLLMQVRFTIPKCRCLAMPLRRRAQKWKSKLS
jgi:hypothetical protein